jgi:GNAT superfamily N-acetyltransferase
VGDLKALAAPEPLAAHHRIEEFRCGETALDEWLRRHALANQASGASRTFVVQHEGRVIGYYALAAGSVARIDAPRKLRRNMPDPIPVVVLGRLAIDSSWQGRGLGFALLRDALLRCHAAASGIGIAGVLVHALSNEAKAFYERAGFLSSPIHPLTLVLPIAALASAVSVR